MASTGKVNCTGGPISPWTGFQTTPQLNVKQIVSGSGSACMLKTDNHVYCVGDNFNGELGLEITKANNEYYMWTTALKFGTGQTPASISANNNGYCVLFASGKASCWGSWTADGQGKGFFYPGYATGTMGDALGFVNVGTGRTIKQLVGMAATNCAILDDDSVKCWGDCTQGQCNGQATFQNQEHTETYYYLGYYCALFFLAKLARERVKHATTKKKTNVQCPHANSRQHGEQFAAH